MNAIDEFKQRLEQDWLIPFCSARGYSHEGFDGKAINQLQAIDARDFMQAVDNGLVTHHDGFFKAPQSKTKEQIFWQGARGSIPRVVTLWLEPIITMAGLWRMHRDFGWPIAQLGLQSKTWAFDFVAYGTTLDSEYITCEVKKTKRETDRLLEFMELHLNSGPEVESDLKNSELNAFRKVLALRESSCKTFWALGPNRYGHVFDVIRSDTGDIELRRATASSLVVPGQLLKHT